MDYFGQGLNLTAFTVEAMNQKRCVVEYGTIDERALQAPYAIHMNTQHPLLKMMS
jgi:hypothetical protein